MAEDDVEVKFGASLEGLQAGIEEAKERIEGLSGPISEIAQSFGELAEAVIAAFAFEKIGEFAEHMGELGEQTERTSKILGISTEQVGELNFAAAMTGTSTENLVMMIGRFEAALPEAAKGTGRVAEGLKALGLNARELQGLNPEQLFEKLAEASSRFADSANKTAAFASLGRGMVQLIPLFDEGAEGFKKLSAGAVEAGVALGAEMTERLADMQHGLVNLHQTIQGLTTAAFAPFINVVNGAVAILTDIAHSMMESAKEGGLLHDILGGVANAFQNLEQFVGETILILKDLFVAGETATNGLIADFMGFGRVVADVFQALGAAIPGFFTALLTAGAEATKAVGQQFVDLGTVISDALHGDFTGAKAAFGDMVTDAAASAGKISGAFKGVFDFSAASEDAKKTTDKLAEIIAEGDKQIVENAKVAQQEYNRIWGIGGEKKEVAATRQVPNLQATGGKQDKSAAKDAEQQFSEEVQAAKEAEASIREGLDERLKTHQLTMAQWLQQSNVALDAEALAVINAADKATAGTALSSEQKKAIWDREEKDLAEIALREQKDFDKAAEEMTKSWTSVADSISGIMNSQVDSLLKGTESIGTAFEKMAASAIEALAKLAVKIAVDAAAMEALSLATGGALGGFGAGGIGGFLEGALFPSHAEGTDYVPQTGLALIHQGEMVVPAHMNPNNPANSNSLGGGSFSNPRPSKS